MASDPKAREVTIPFPGGFMNLTRGLAEVIFGNDLQGLETAPVSKSVSVKGHTRTRVIGGPSINVGAYNYTYLKYPTGVSENAEGGEPVIVDLGTAGKWTVRVHGPLYHFADFLEKKTKLSGLFFTSQRGSVYGPFQPNQN